MKILVINPTCPRGHKFYDYEILRNFSKFCSVTYIEKEKFIEEEKLKNLEIKIIRINQEKYPLDPELNMSRKNKILHWLKCYTVLFYIKNIVNFDEYDKIFFLDFNFITVYFFNLINNKEKIFLVNHRMGTITQKIKKNLLNNLSKKINIIFLSEYIKNYYKQIFPKYTNLFVLHHPLLPLQKIEKNNQINNLIFAPGASNSEKFINQIYKDRNLIMKVLVEKKIKLIIKCKNLSFKSENLIIYNSFLEKEEYKNFMNYSICIAQFYNSDFDYITSGVFYEALGYSKPILALRNKFIENMKPIMKDNLIIFDDISSFLENLNNVRNFNKNEFNESYSSLQKKLENNIKYLLEVKK